MQRMVASVPTSSTAEGGHQSYAQYINLRLVPCNGVYPPSALRKHGHVEGGHCFCGPRCNMGFKNILPHIATQ